MKSLITRIIKCMHIFSVRAIYKDICGVLSLVADVGVSSFYLFWHLNCIPMPYFTAQDNFTYLVKLVV